jgi:pyruvate carboxylase
MDPDKDIAFPEASFDDARRSRPAAGGWPEGIQKKVLKGEKPYTERPGSLLPPADLDANAPGIEERWSAISPSSGASPPISCIRRSSPTSRAHRDLRSGLVAADAGLFLWPEARRRDRHRARKGQDAGHALSWPSANRTKRAWSRVFFELNGQPRTHQGA